MFFAASAFFELRDSKPKDSEEYKYYEAMRMLAANIEDICKKLDAIERRINQIPR